MNIEKSNHQLATLNKKDHLSSTYYTPGSFTHLVLKVKLCESNLMPILQIKKKQKQKPQTCKKADGQ